MSNVLRGVITNPDKIYGKSAYEIAVMHGFDGTEEEWVKATDLAKEITLDSATKAQYYAGLAETANENAGMHETDARESAREAQAHLQEVRNIVDAAGEKLDLLANIPDDYITLDADVKSNTALIAGNKEDIASNERAIAKNAENITRNTKRITNIEQGLTPDSFETDDSVAYQKDVPANALPYAAVQKVGGMTRKCANLIPFPYLSTVNEVNGVSVIAHENGTITFSGKCTSGWTFILCERLMSAGNYYLGDGVTETGMNLLAYDIDNGAVVSWEGAFSLTKDTMVRVYYLIADTFNGNCVVSPMLNEGSAKPYEPYYEGLLSAKVTEVKSVGENLFGGEALANGIVDCYKGIKNEGTETVSFLGVDTNNAPRLYTDFKPNTQYTFIIYGKNETSLTSNLGIFYEGFYSSMNFPEINTKGYVVLQSEAGETVKSFGGLFANGELTELEYDKCGIFEGAITIEDFKPYQERTLPIPEAVRPANGINENVYDYIEWAEDGNRKQVVRCGVVDLGTLTWHIESYYAYSQSLASKAKSSAQCDSSALPAGVTEMSIAASKALVAYFTEGAYTDAAAVKAAMSGVMLVYELAEPIITDISDLITADNLIGVEGGGTLTFENEYGYAVPSEVEYQVEV